MWLLNEQIVKNTLGVLYHISTYKNIKVLNKRIPESIPKLFPSKEDNFIERVCFSNSIDGCLSSICPSYNKNLYVYTPVNSNLKLKVPTMKQVFDCKVTNEIWVTDDIPVKCIGIIQVSTVKEKKKHKNYVRSFTEYVYNWEWVKRYIN